MPSRIDTSGSRGFQQLSMQLNKGLDLSGNPLQREPGSLIESLNVSVQDGVLQTAPAPVAIGRGKACDIPWGDVWLIEGATVSLSGSFSSTTPYKIEWYYGAANGNYDQSRYAPAGSGFLWSFPTHGYGGSAVWAITHTSGLPPQGATYFRQFNNTRTLTITSGQRFSNIESQLDTLGTTPHFITNTAIRNVLWNLGTWHSLSTLTTGSTGVGVTLAYQGVPGVGGISHVFGHSDSVYAVRDWPILKLSDTYHEVRPYTTVTISDGVDTHTALAIWHRIENSADAGLSWCKDGLYSQLYIGPNFGNDSMTELNALFDMLADDTTGFIVYEGATQIGTLLATDFYGSHPGINPHFEGHGLMFELDIVDEGVGESFKWKELGYSLKFESGIVDPHVDDGPLIPSDSLPYLQDSGWIDVTATTQGTAISSLRTAWSNLANTTAEDAVVATSGPLLGVSAGPYPITGNLGWPPGSDGATGNFKVVGLELRIKASSNGAGTYLNEVMLYQTGGSNHTAVIPLVRSLTAAKAVSENRALGDLMSGSLSWYTFGGQTDTWGLTNLDYFDTADDSLLATFRFDDGTGASPTISVDAIQVRWHYLRDSTYLYLYDTRDSVDAGTILVHGLQVHDGDWSTDDASGWMSIETYDETVPFRSGMEVRTEAGGAGELIATAVELTPNILPSSDAIASVNTRAQMRVGVISEGIGKERTYVTNGVGPAFAVDHKDRFQFIRLPVDPDKDRPRHVEIIPGHLLLSTEEHLFVSSIGNFNNFATFDGATVWSLNDRINGMQRMPDNTVILGCSRSIQRLAGSSASGSDPFNIKHVSSARGTLANGMVLADDLYMISENGISGLGASDKFGDFEGGVLSAHIEPYLRPRLAKRLANKGVAVAGYVENSKVGDFTSRGFLQALPSRSTNQIYYFFADGDILVASLPGANAPNQQRIEYTIHNYSANIGTISSTYEKHYVTPTDELQHRLSAGCSFVTSEGKEWVIVGTYGGTVMRLGAGPHVCNFSYFSTNPVSADPTMEGTVQVERTSVLIEHLMHHNTAINQQPDGVPPVWFSSGYFGSTDRPELVYDYPSVSSSVDDYSFSEWSLHPVTTYQPATSSAFSWAVGSYGSGTQTRNYFPIKYHMLTAKIAGRSEGKSFGQRPTSIGGALNVVNYSY